MNNFLKFLEGKLFRGKFNLEVYLEIEKKSKLITFLNPYSYLKLRKQFEVLQHFDIIFIDGILLKTMLTIIGFSDIIRYSFDFTSLAGIFFEMCERHGLKITLVGSTQEHIRKSTEKLSSKYKRIIFAGIYSGYFKDQDEKESVLKEIIINDPNFVLVGMGTVNQEKFLIQLANKGWKGIGITCGGLFHQIKERLSYYPSVLNKYNLRWLYRIKAEPHLIYRYFIIYPVFIFIFLKDYINYSRN